jgi:SNARE protein
MCSSGAKELVDAAKRIQQESKESTTRTKQQLQHTIEIGASTNAKLKEQTQQLEGVDKKVEQIDDNLKRADKQIRIFMRRMATDKVVLALVLMVVLGIIGAIVAHYIKNPNVSF